MLNSYKDYPVGLKRRLKYSKELQERQIVRPFIINEIFTFQSQSTAFINFQSQFKNEGLVSENLLNNSNVGIFLTINQDNICPICINHFILNSIYRKLICNHIFHIECIDKWFINNNKCPMCRNCLVN
jgi:hypothetical protein